MSVDNKKNVQNTKVILQVALSLGREVGNEQESISRWATVIISTSARRLCHLFSSVAEMADPVIFLARTFQCHTMFIFNSVNVPLLLQITEHKAYM